MKLEIRGCTLDNNYSDEDGGAIYIDEEDNNVEYCSITWNSCRVDGGGICINDDRASITNCEFSLNHAYDDGGATYVTVGTDDAVFTGCTFEGNRADDCCNDVDGRSDTIINGSGSMESKGNIVVIICVAAVLIVIFVVLLILKKKGSAAKNPKE